MFFHVTRDAAACDFDLPEESSPGDQPDSQSDDGTDVYYGISVAHFIFVLSSDEASDPALLSCS